MLGHFARTESLQVRIVVVGLDNSGLVLDNSPNKPSSISDALLECKLHQLIGFGYVVIN